MNPQVSNPLKFPLGECLAFDSATSNTDLFRWEHPG